MAGTALDQTELKRALQAAVEAILDKINADGQKDYNAADLDLDAAIRRLAQLLEPK